MKKILLIVTLFSIFSINKALAQLRMCSINRTISGSASVCPGTTGHIYTTQSGMSNYQWTVTGGAVITSVATTNTVTVTAPSSGSNFTVRVSYTDTNGCNELQPAYKSVSTIPLPATVTGNSITCQSSTGNTYTTEAGKSNYIWSISHGGVITAGGTTNDNFVTITWPYAAPSATVDVTYRDAALCINSGRKSVNVTSSPWFTGNTSVCQGSTGNVYTTASGMTNYVWSVSPGGIITSGGTSTDNTVTVTWSSSGPQSISVGYTAGASTCQPATQTINVTAPPVYGNAFTEINSIESYNTEPGMSTYNWIVSAGGTIQSGQGSRTVQVLWNSTGPQTISVSYNNGSGCSGSVTKTVTVQEWPTLSGNTEVCGAGSVGHVYTTEDGKSEYEWSVTGGTITDGGTPTSNSITVTWNTSGSVYLRYRYSNGDWSPYISKGVAMASTAEFYGDRIACPGPTEETYTATPGMTNYNWSVSSGGTITSGGNSTSNVVTIVWNTPGDQSITLSYTNSNGCATPPITANITVRPLPIPTIAGSAQTCAASSNVYTTESGMSEYSWGSSEYNTIISSGANTATLRWNNGGDKTISVRYKDFNGCVSAIAQKTITVKRPTISVPITHCIGATTMFSTETGMSNYVWTASPDGAITNNGTATPQIIWNTTGSKSIAVTYTDATGCTSNSLSYSTTVVDPPGYIPSTVEPKACTGLTYVYSTLDHQTNYVWNISPGGTIISGGTTADHSVTMKWNTAGNQTVSINYSNSHGCAGATPTVTNVTVSEPLVPTLTGASTGCFTSTANSNTYETEAGMYSYSWTASPGGTISTTNGNPVPNGGTISCESCMPNSVKVTWDSPGEKTLSVSYKPNGDGCTSITVTKNITVHALPSPTLSASTSTACIGSSVTYTTEPGKSNYNWSYSAYGTLIDGGTSTSNTMTVIWNFGTTNNAGVGYSDVNGCTKHVGISTTMRPAVPFPKITPQNSTACVGASGNVYSTEAGMSNYTWSIPPSGTITAGGTSTDNTVTVTWNSPGSKTISVLYNEPTNGCRTTSSIPAYVSVSALPVPSISRNSGCLTSGNYYATEAGMSNYQWSISGGTVTDGATASSNSATITWNSIGPKSVGVTYTTPNGCVPSAPTITNFTVNNLPIPTLSGPFEVPIEHAATPSPPYLPTTGLASYQTDAGMQNYTWWYDGTAVFHHNVTGGTVWQGIGLHTIQVTYTDPNGCEPTFRTSRSVTVAHNQTVSFSGTYSNPYLCGTPPFNIYASASSTLPITFTSSNPSVATVSGNIVTIQGAGTTTITASQAGDSDYFPASAQKVLNVIKRTQSITFSLPSGAFTYGDLPFSLTATGGASGNSVTYTSSNPAVAVVNGNTVSIVGAGTTTITASQSGDAIYSDAAPVARSLSVNKASQTISFGSLAAVCQGTSLTLPALTSAGLPISYTSSNPASVSVTGNVLTITGTSSVNITATQLGDNNYLAAASVAQPLAVVAKPVATISGPTSLCKDPIALSAGSATSYLWSNGATSNSISVSSAGNYTVIVTNANGCSSTSQAFVVTDNRPKITMTSGTLGVCGSAINATLSASPGSSYLWSTGQTTQSIVTSSPGDYSVAITNPQGCDGIMTTNAFKIDPPPFSVSIDGDLILCTGASSTLLTAKVQFSNGRSALVSPYPQYLWSTGETTRSINVSTSGNYTVTVTDNGCQFSASVSVKTNTIFGSISTSGDLCLNAQVYLTAGEGSSYTWSNGGVGRTIVVYEPGTYSVSYENFNGCIVSDSRLIVRSGTMCNNARARPDSLEIPEPDITSDVIIESTEFSIFPNPSNLSFTIHLVEPAQESYAAILVDNIGKPVSEIRFEKGEQTKRVTTEQLVPGVYILKIGTPKGTLMKKIMISHRQ